MNFKKSFLLPLSVMLMSSIHSQTIIPLYKGAIPNSRPCSVVEVSPLTGRVGGVTVPVLYAYLPEKPDSAKAAVIICPGGGYSRLAIDHEGHEVAKNYNKQGIAAFVLKYRLPIDTACVENTETVALMDAQQAIKIVRDRAAEFNINPGNVGIMGFSAGGHLASSLGTHYAVSLITNKENTNLRPDFMVLGYPVISFTDSLAHKGSRDNMLGKKASKEKIELYSNELQVTPNTPPTFLIHAADDKTVKVENSLEFFLALKKNKIPAEIHIVQKGGHGFGLHNKEEPGDWLDWVFVWMKANKLY
jgi:acetyl esterase/lipase